MILCESNGKQNWMKLQWHSKCLIHPLDFGFCLCPPIPPSQYWNTTQKSSKTACQHDQKYFSHITLTWGRGQKFLFPQGGSCHNLSDALRLFWLTWYVYKALTWIFETADTMLICIELFENWLVRDRLFQSDHTKERALLLKPDQQWQNGGKTSFNPARVFDAWLWLWRNAVCFKSFHSRREKERLRSNVNLLKLLLLTTQLGGQKWRTCVVIQNQSRDRWVTKTPNYTRDSIPPHQQSQYSLRKHDVIEQMRTRTEKFKSTFYPHCLAEWNALGTETRLAPSVTIFKKKMLSKIRPPGKPVYGIHDPKGLSYLT